jgi:hypothetical protein
MAAERGLGPLEGISAAICGPGEEEEPKAMTYQRVRISYLMPIDSVISHYADRHNTNRQVG